ncbi:MAG: UDP-2,3-diacylglucosamine diphosphatase [Ignavibacteria bacterium]|nr:UDP-2,3-diacylglucosamine diphosphatase [Ignavibacteria bacterium]
MSDSYYFFSDVHLGLESPEKERKKERKLIRFLESASEDAAEIFIVGDLFDCWIEYKQVVPKGFYRLLAKISELVESGITINYIAGNHDFWKGDYFRNEFGIEICHEHIERVIEGKKFFIHHGDGFAYNDSGYRILKKVMRSKLSQRLYSLIHPDIGIRLAKGTSETSRVHTSAKDYSKSDGLRDAAFSKVDEGFDYVIMGHRHLPQMIRHNQGYYVNLGDWIEHSSYGLFRNGVFELTEFKSKEEAKTASAKI